MVKQCTIAKEISCSGIGLHTGNMTRAVFKPAPPGSWVKFVRKDMKNSPHIPALYDHVVGLVRGTSIGIKKAVVYTVEHLLSTLCGLGIDNIEVELNNNEPPVFDGSADYFVKILQEAGIVEQDAEREYVTLSEPVIYRSGNGRHTVEISAYPADELKVDYKINYNHPIVGKQEVSIVVNRDTFIKELSLSRTYCFDYEIEKIKSLGLGKGGRLDNTLVIGIDRIHNPDKLRYDDELVRHKVLDFLGDIYLLGKPLKAHVVAKRSGHAHNISFVKKIAAAHTKK